MGEVARRRSHDRAQWRATASLHTRIGRQNSRLQRVCLDGIRIEAQNLVTMCERPANRSSRQKASSYLFVDQRIATADFQGRCKMRVGFAETSRVVQRRCQDTVTVPVPGGDTNGVAQKTDAV